MKKYNSIDQTPWNHPFLTQRNLKRFYEYSIAVREIAVAYQNRYYRPLNIAFAVNMAQNMYKWACLAQDYGERAALFLNAMDTTAMSCPEWEEFDGEFENIFNGSEFLSKNKYLEPRVPTYNIPIEENVVLWKAYDDFHKGNRKGLLSLLSSAPDLRYEIFFTHFDGFFPYYSWAKALSTYDVIYGTSTPFAIYASGRPYCLTPVGGDLQYDCGREDSIGDTMSLAFNASRFLIFSSNAQILGHCRRLGLTNGLLLPYPMDTNRYCPGYGNVRKKWESQFGKGIYILSTCRLDDKVKGQGDKYLHALIEAAGKCSKLKFIFLLWGNSKDDFRQKLKKTTSGNQFILLPPVGKKRLIEYYRSADIILDQFVSGYYGATLLEAASIGKPVIMKIRKEHYAPFYNGDVAPVVTVEKEETLTDLILTLSNDSQLRSKIGEGMRKWVTRNHGQDKTVPVMLSLLRMAADNVTLPEDLKNPLLDVETAEEIAYHNDCLMDVNEKN